mmetsp:Transcript_16311/g.25210  ORF Transcript_16311/g.25210 Transcript_16311/m.25210 type:complete len:627 (+) Transcript_16311:395-2275(+)
MQAQLKDYEGFAESRRKIMVSKSGVMQNWITYLVALYLNKQYDLALEVFGSIENQIETHKDSQLKPYEISEIYLFKVKIMEAMGDLKGAVKYLTKKKVSNIILDEFRKNEELARLQIAIGQKVKGIETYEQLLRLNSSSTDYYRAILAAQGIKLEKGDVVKTEQKEEFLKIMDKYMQVLPKAPTHSRLVVEHLPAGPEFKSFFVKHIRPMLIKGVPSLLNDFRCLYKQEGKSAIVEEVLLEFNKNMESEMVLDLADKEEQDPTIQFWLYYFLSQHYFFLGNVEKSLEYINKAIEHTPTVMDIYTFKAKIMQFAGDRIAADKLTGEARNLDQADRHLNAINAKYQLKVDNVEKAHQTMSLFSREDDNGKPNIHEMQTMWFEIECGKAHYRLNDFRQALKQFNYIDLHLETMLDDCYDFHHYSFRKVTINHYLQMIQFQDEAFQGKWPIRGCLGFLRTLSKIKANSKALLEQGKKDFEAFKETEDYKKWLADADNREDDDPVRSDQDPEGWEMYLKACENPVPLALQIAEKVAPLNPTCAETQAKCMQWFIAGEKHDLVLTCIENLLTHNAAHPKTPKALEKFKAYAASAKVEGATKEKLETIQSTLVKSFKPAAEESMEHVHEQIKL